MAGDKEPRDNTTFTVRQFIGPRRKLAGAIFFYVFLVLFRASLVSMIRINQSTLCNFDFHCRMMELLHLTQQLLSMKGGDYRGY
jgi:hypothetical protein